MFSSHSQSHEKVIPTFPHMNDLSQPGLQFSHLDDNQRPIKRRHTCEKELYVRDMIVNNFCAKIGQDNLLGYHPSSSLRCTLQSSFTDGLLGRQNWFHNEHQSHNVWPGIESSRSGVQSGCADGSLLSVLPEFKDLACRSLFDTSGSEQPLQALNYIGISLADTSIPTQVSSCSTGLTSAPIPSLDMVWMHYSHQNPPSLQESVWKPFMRHRHQ